MSPMGGVGLAVLAVVGVAVLWAQRLARIGRQRDDALRLVLQIAGWTLILAVFIGGALETAIRLKNPAAAILGVLASIPVLIVVGMVVHRYRQIEARTVAWTLSLGARRGVPLEQVAEALFRERYDEIGLRAGRLAELLRSGFPLPAALDGARLKLSTETLAAVHLGTETGNLGTALASVDQPDDDIHLAIRSAFERGLYLTLVVNVMVVLLTFMMLKIVPVFAKMFQEFELELPALTQVLIACSQFATADFPLVLPLGMALAFGLLFLGAIYYVGWLPRDLPIVNLLAFRYDCSAVMRLLGWSITRGMPLESTVWLLARHYPRTSMRARLSQALVELRGGLDWIEALRRARICSASDAALLQASSRCGNLPWALAELGNAKLRRLAYRLRVWTDLLFPIVLLAIGLAVMFVVVSLFMPLVSLIESLT